MRDEQTTNIEDIATQPMEAGGLVSQFRFLNWVELVPSIPLDRHPTTHRVLNT